MENMTTREKIDHIWYYYKVQIIAILVGLILIAGFVYSLTTRKDIVLNVTLLGKTINPEKQEMLENDITSKFISNPKKETSELIFMNYSKDPKSQVEMAGAVKLQAMIAAKSIDIAVMDKETFQTLAKQEALYNLDNIKGLPLSQYKQSDIMKLTPEGSASPCTYGVNAENIKPLLDTGYDIQGKVICIMANSKHIDRASECMNWLLSK